MPAVSNQKTENFFIPETYWFMNELWPCIGDQSQLASYPEVCTSGLSYRVFKDQPAEAFLTFLERSDKCGDGNLARMKAQIETFSTSIWPMFSLESLSST